MGVILNITLSKTMSSNVTIVHETSGEITLKITIPEDLRAENREFGIYIKFDPRQIK